MTLEAAIILALFSNDYLMTIDDIETYIVNKGFVQKSPTLKQDIQKLISQSGNIINFNNTYLFFAMEDPLSFLHDTLQISDPNSADIKTVTGIDPDDCFIDIIETIKEPRIRYAAYLNLVEYYAEIEYFAVHEYIDSMLKDNNIKIQAYALILLSTRDVLISLIDFGAEEINYDNYISTLSHSLLSEFAFINLDFVLWYHNIATVQESIADLLLDPDQNISENAFNFLFKESPITSFPTIFFILSNWSKYSSVLFSDYSLKKHQVEKLVEDASDSNYFKHKPIDIINNEFMIDFCNSGDLRIKALAINFMKHRWEKVSYIDKIKRNSKAMNSNIKIGLLDSYMNIGSKKAINYAEKWLSDKDPLVMVKSTYVLGEIGEERERQLLVNIALTYMKKPEDDVPVYITNALSKVNKRLDGD